VTTWTAPGGLDLPAATGLRFAGPPVPGRIRPAVVRGPAGPGAAELRAIREADLRRTVDHVVSGGQPVRVGRYALVDSRHDPAPRLAETQSVVHRRGWKSVITTFDNSGADDDPAHRTQLARLVTALGTQKIQGIVAVSQVDISSHHDTYANLLAVLRARSGFLALAHPENTFWTRQELAPWT
jgi:hypothetical protein